MFELNTELMTVLLKNESLDDIFRSHLEKAVNDVLKIELTAFLAMRRAALSGTTPATYTHKPKVCLGQTKLSFSKMAVLLSREAWMSYTEVAEYNVIWWICRCKADCGIFDKPERNFCVKKYLMPMIILAIFETIAVTLWLSKDNIFYLFNFSYIGLSISFGLFLFIRKYKHARHIVQLMVGMYMLVYLGLICRENMQIEGFWYYLFTGVFEAATIHYAVAKIFGPLVFGRGWCGYACWTALVLDFLPYKVPERPRKKIGWLRYITFAASLLFVAALFLAKVVNIERIMFAAFIIGNIVYYGVGIALAYTCKDNRAFCKYICPITVFLKPMSYFSLLRIKCNKERCISCGKCKRVCPMNVNVTDNARKRENGTECILCMECVRNCPKGAL